MESQTFLGTVDRYNGVTVDSKEEPCEAHLIISKLSDSLKKWIEEDKRCIWFKVHIKDATWVPLLANEGFNFHHSREDFVMMYKWLPTNHAPNLPPACHTNLGVGGLVLNDKNQLLAVSEKSIEIPHWKLPGGYVERGEDIKDAAVREVKEETGIDATFETLITFRHTHNSMFGNSDIYVVVVLKATSETIIKSETEIEACKWMDIHEFVSHPHVHDFNRSLVRQAVQLRNKNLKLNLVKKTQNIGNWSREITSVVLEDLE